MESSLSVSIEIGQNYEEDSKAKWEKYRNSARTSRTVPHP